MRKRQNITIKQIRLLLNQNLTERQMKLLTAILFQKAMNGNIAALRLILQIMGEI